MSLGFFVGIQNGIAKIMGHDGSMIDVPAARIPKGLQPGHDFDYRASKRGHIHITEPAQPGVKRETNSAFERQQYAVKRLVSKGWSPAQASGAVGRFMQESYADLRTKALGDRSIPGGSYGIMQVNRDRKAALFSFAKARGKDPSDFDTQIDFFDHEIRTSPHERTALIALEGAKTPEDAATAMMHYERPSGYKPGRPQGGHGYANTVRNAQNVLKGYDPNYTPQAVASVDASGASEGAGINPDDPGFSSIDAGAEGGADQPIDAGQTEEDTFGGQLSQIAGDYGSAGGGGGDLSESSANIQNMIQQGVQSESQGGAFPTFGELFGNG